MSEENNNNNNEDLTLQLNELQNQLNQQVEINNKLTKQNEDFFGELKNVKGKLGEFQQAAQNEEEKALLGNGEEGLKAILEQRLNAATKNFDETIGNISNERDELSNQVLKLQNDIKVNEFRNKFNSILPNTDINKTAYADITDIAMRQSEIIDGKIVFKDENGTALTRNSQGKEYTEMDFINEQRSKRAYMFEIQQGNDNKQGKNSSGAYEYTDAKISEIYASGDSEKINKLNAAIDSGKVQIVD